MEWAALMKIPISALSATWLLTTSLLAKSPFDGQWRGTYRTLDYEGFAVGGEIENEFELMLRAEGNRIQGKIVGTASHRLRPQVRNGRLYSDGRACFDVFDDRHDMRWCVTVSENRMEGGWSLGPAIESTGAGGGARVYRIKARMAR